jgi:hypothetical protein
VSATSAAGPSMSHSVTGGYDIFPGPIFLRCRTVEPVPVREIL